MVKVKVPATTANLGTGFDALGVALSLYLEVEMDFHYRNEIHIVEADREITMELDDNLVYQGALRVFQAAGMEKPTLKINMNNAIPQGKGLGSSAAALVAGMWAANALIGRKYPADQLINWAVTMEGHPDNIVPAAVGGLAIAMAGPEGIKYQKIDLLPDLTFTVAVPDFILPTEESRKVLPEKVPLPDMIANLQRACFLVAALSKHDYNNISLAMDDTIFQPVRKQFIPGIDDVIAAACKAGAWAAVISGAGPSIAALSNKSESSIGPAMKNAFLKYSIPASIYHLKVDCNGIRFLK